MSNNGERNGRRRERRERLSIPLYETSRSMVEKKNVSRGPFNRVVRVPPAKRLRADGRALKKDGQASAEIRSPQDLDPLAGDPTKTRSAAATSGGPRRLDSGERAEKRDENKLVEICSVRNVTT